MTLLGPGGQPMNRAQRRAAGERSAAPESAAPPPMAVRPWGDLNAYGLGFLETTDRGGEPCVLALRWNAAAGDVMVQADGTVLLRCRPDQTGRQLVLQNVPDFCKVAAAEAERVHAAADAVAEAEDVARAAAEPDAEAGT